MNKLPEQDGTKNYKEVVGQVDPIVMLGVDSDKYISKCGHELKREYGKTPNGNDLNGRWVFRNSYGDFIDFDKYRNDLAERNNLYLCSA